MLPPFGSCTPHDFHLALPRHAYPCPSFSSFSSMHQPSRLRINEETTESRHDSFLPSFLPSSSYVSRFVWLGMIASSRLVLIFHEGFFNARTNWNIRRGERKILFLFFSVHERDFLVQKICIGCVRSYRSCHDFFSSCGCPLMRLFFFNYYSSSLISHFSYQELGNIFWKSGWFVFFASR